MNKITKSQTEQRNLSEIVDPKACKGLSPNFDSNIKRI